MIPRNRLSIAAETCIPRESGDDPSATVSPSHVKTYSPRERG